MIRLDAAGALADPPTKTAHPHRAKHRCQFPLATGRERGVRMF
jgi:hypothetical protein